MNVRAAERTEIDHLATVWYDAWHEAHAHLVPSALTRLRTFDSLRERWAM